jgi:hypothetical protein
MPGLPDNPNLNCLVELASRDGVDIRPTLLRVATDLYVQKPTHSADEELHFTELALRLFDMVDARTRAIVAEKISAYPSAPEAVRRRVLREIEQSKPASITPSATDPFAGRSATADELTELFFAASSEERRLILTHLPHAPLAPAHPIEATLAQDAIQRLEVAALGHNSQSFVRELQRTLALSLTLARRVLDDPWGEPIVVAAVALGMPASVLQRILLCLHPSISQSVQRVYDLALLHDELAPESALRLLAIWQAARTTVDRSDPSKPRDDKLRTIAARPRPHETAPARRDVPLTRPKILGNEHAEPRKESA